LKSHTIQITLSVLQHVLKMFVTGTNASGMLIPLVTARSITA